MVSQMKISKKKQEDQDVSQFDVFFGSDQSISVSSIHLLRFLRFSRSECNNTRSGPRAMIIQYISKPKMEA